jgi:hypothetical protein
VDGARSCPPIFAVFVNFRTPDLTIAAVEALERGDSPCRATQVTIVDNGSGDDSAARLHERFPQHRVLVSCRNRGFAGGNNLALRRIQERTADIQGEERQRVYILLLNTDVLVEPTTVYRLAEFLDRNPDVGVAGPCLRLPDGQLDLACRRLFPTPERSLWRLTGLAKRFPKSPRFAGYNLTYLDEDLLTEVDAVTAAAMLVRLTAIDQAGLLDERFFMYGEDLDWCFRIKAAGWRVYYVPEARATHLKSATAKRQSYRMIYEFYRAMLIFHRKHYAPRLPWFVNGIVVAGVIGRGGIAALLNVFRPAPRKRFA